MTEDISPAVKILESNYISNTDKQPTQNIALFVGEFEKGDINQPKLITSALEFKLTFGRATEDNYNDWYQVYNYLQYPGSPKIWVCRTSGLTNINASNNGNIANSPGGWGNLLTVEIYSKHNYNDYLKEQFEFYNDSEIVHDYLVLIKRKDSIVEKFIISNSSDLKSNYLQEINLEPGIYKLSGGYSDSAALFNYVESFELFTKENYDIDIVISPEYYNDIVINFVESRKDCVGFLCIPRQLIQYLMINGVNLATEKGELIVLSVKNILASKSDLNHIIDYIKSIKRSQYCFMTFGFKIQIDGFTGKKRIITVNGDIAGLKAANSSNIPWGIPSGVERGNIKNAEGFTMKLTKGDSDKLYKLGINTLNNSTILTQKLFIEKEEFCTRLHQRCVFNYVERAIEKLTRMYIFSENSKTIRGQIAMQIKKILEDILSSGGIEYGKVYVSSDETNKIIINIYIKIPNIIEVVNIRMLNTGTQIGFINEI